MRRPCTPIYEGDGKALERWRKRTKVTTAWACKPPKISSAKLQREDRSSLTASRPCPMRSAPPAGSTGRRRRIPRWPPQGKTGHLLLRASGPVPEALPRRRRGQHPRRRPNGSCGRHPMPTRRADTKVAARVQWLVEKVRAKFQRAFADHMAEGGLPHRLSPPQRKALD